MQTRKRLRSKYNLEEAPCGDCMVATFWCARQAAWLAFHASGCEQHSQPIVDRSLSRFADLGNVHMLPQLRVRHLPGGQRAEGTAVSQPGWCMTRTIFLLGMCLSSAPTEAFRVL